MLVIKSCDIVQFNQSILLAIHADRPQHHSKYACNCPNHAISTVQTYQTTVGSWILPRLGCFRVAHLTFEQVALLKWGFLQTGELHRKIVDHVPIDIGLTLEALTAFAGLVHEKVRKVLRRFDGIRCVGNVFVTYPLVDVLLRMELDAVEWKSVAKVTNYSANPYPYDLQELCLHFMFDGGNELQSVPVLVGRHNPPLPIQPIGGKILFGHAILVEIRCNWFGR